MEWNLKVRLRRDFIVRDSWLWMENSDYLLVWSQSTNKQSEFFRYSRESHTKESLYERTLRLHSIYEIFRVRMTRNFTSESEF